MLKERKRVSLEEQETTITLSPGDKNAAMVYTCVPHMNKRIYQYARDYPDQVMIYADDGYGVDAELPASWVSLKPRRKRNPSGIILSWSAAGSKRPRSGPRKTWARYQSAGRTGKRASA